MKLLKVIHKPTGTCIVLKKKELKAYLLQYGLSLDDCTIESIDKKRKAVKQ